MNTQNCPCGSQKTYLECCGLYIVEKKTPTTPEALMRSRYSAYVMADVDYLATTMQGAPLEHFDAKQTQAWAKHASWLELRIINAPPVNDTDTVGFVEFIAHYRFQGKVANIHEISEFHRIENRWYYVNGKAGNIGIAKQHAFTKIGRNDPCLCGSGKKYKKCCETVKT